MLVCWWSASVHSLRPCMITVWPSQNLGGPVRLRLEPSCCISRHLGLLCTLFHCHTFWRSCPLFRLVILAPFPVTYMDARTHATPWACATGLASLALAAPCSTSTPGPWSGKSTTSQLAFEVWNTKIKKPFVVSILCNDLKHVLAKDTFSIKLMLYVLILAFTSIYLLCVHIHAIRAYTSIYGVIYMHV